MHTLIHKNLNGGGRKSLKKELGPMYRLVVQNPTGHYKLDVAIAAERCVGRGCVPWVGGCLQLPSGDPVAYLDLSYT